MTRKMILVGAGGFGGHWCAHFLPPNMEDGVIEVVAAVDINPDALQNARKYLGLRDDQCFTDVARAFDAVRADFCAVVVPPPIHEQVVDLALAHDMHILSEKPIADTMEAAVRVADKVKRAGKKMAVTMSHRFDQDKTTLRAELRSGRYGRLDYLICALTTDCRKYGAMGFRHEMVDPLMVEAAIHHLDLLADLAGAPCQTIYAQTWNPPWGEYTGDSQGLALLHFDNGARAVYEGALSNAVGLYGWTRDYFRAECEGATFVLDHRRLERFVYDPSRTWADGRPGQGEEVPLIQQPKWSNAWLIEQFVQWLDGGEPMATNVEDNLQSMALVFAAIESSRNDRPVDVQAVLAAARTAVAAA
ncbi:MAG: Gfo/Idh/MocA family oxidoreductase [Anaerolineae bacterium]|nr:Gfo/Idh/MocA family oxidoreductase [Anaerolineae bacterium]